MLTYTVLRLAIFAGCLALLWLLGLRAPDQQLLLVVLAGVLSMAVSFVALKGPRQRLSARISDRVEHVVARRSAQPTDEAQEDRETG